MALGKLRTGVLTSFAKFDSNFNNNDNNIYLYRPFDLTKLEIHTKFLNFMVAVAWPSFLSPSMYMSPYSYCTSFLYIYLLSLQCLPNVFQTSSISPAPRFFCDTPFFLHFFSSRCLFYVPSSAPPLFRRTHYL